MMLSLSIIINLKDNQNESDSIKQYTIQLKRYIRPLY
jgi:hypothetical protein